MQVLDVEYFYSSGLCLHLLASCSRDRLIHIFDVAHNYAVVQTLDEHSAAVTCIKFVSLRTVTQLTLSDDQHCSDVQQMALAAAAAAGADKSAIRLISCSADHSLLFRSLQVRYRGRRGL